MGMLHRCFGGVHTQSYPAPGLDVPVNRMPAGRLSAGTRLRGASVVNCPVRAAGGAPRLPHESGDASPYEDTP
jgi:hypothetical protein